MSTKKEFDANLMLSNKPTREQRIDWVMRQFVDNIINDLKNNNIDSNAARRRMTERGVPLHVQNKVLHPHCKRHLLDYE